MEGVQVDGLAAAVLHAEARRHSRLVTRNFYDPAQSDPAGLPDLHLHTIGGTRRASHLADGVDPLGAGEERRRGVTGEIRAQALENQAFAPVAQVGPQCLRIDAYPQRLVFDLQHSTHRTHGYTRARENLHAAR